MYGIKRMEIDIMNAYPHFPGRRTLSLDGSWNFTWLGSSSFDQIDPAGLSYETVTAVPGVFDTCAAYYGRRGIGVYRKTFEWGGGIKTRLNIGALGLAARIWWDGKLLGDWKIPYSPAAYDFDSGKGDYHELVIAVDNRIGCTPLFSPNFDFYAYGGIYRSVSLQELPETRIERVRVKTLDLKQGLVQLRVFGSASIPDDAEFSVRFDRGEILKCKGKTLKLKVPSAKIWSPESPSLHTVMLSYGNDTIVERFGIRTVETKGQDILLNGKPVKLQGVNRHEAHPEFGPVQNDHLMIEDIRLLKDLGANFVRCVHYPHSQEFFDFCDESGMLVWAESMGWNNTPEDVSNPEFFALQVEQTRIFAEGSVNHASIILWGFMNECCSHTEEGRKLYIEHARQIRAVEPSFLVTFASNRKENDICFDLADVISMTMYPGWFEDLDWNKASKDIIEPYIEKKALFTEREDLINKPFVVAEIGCCGIYGIHDRGLAQWSEEYQASYFEEACRCIMKNPRYAGIALWQFFDSRSHVNCGDVRGKTRGFNCAGLLDEYRRPKIAYDTVRKIFHENKWA